MHKANKDPSVCLPASTRSLPAFSRLLPALPALPALLDEIWGGLAHVCWQSWQSRQSWQESRKSWQASNMMQGCWQAFCQCEIQLCIIVVAHLQAHTNIVYWGGNPNEEANPHAHIRRKSKRTPGFLCFALVISFSAVYVCLFLVWFKSGV